MDACRPWASKFQPRWKAARRMAKKRARTDRAVPESVFWNPSQQAWVGHKKIATLGAVFKFSYDTGDFRQAFDNICLFVNETDE